MNLKITHKYLTVPVNSQAVKKKILFYDEGKLVFDLDCRVDMLNPDFTAYVDVARFAGRTLDIRTDPWTDFRAGEADEISTESLYREEYRPTVHYSVKNGYNNDPNGLIFAGGVYHMFYQYNPCGTEWGNMHWGHAESTDLINWTEKDIALFPDETGTMYSGSAITDRENLTGFGSPERPAMLLFYTAAGERNLLSGDRKRTQCIAYSADGGKTFVKYGGNPVIDFIIRYNRDPKVIFVPEIGKYVMALFLIDNTFTLFTSIDLIHWEKLQDIVIAEESECPDIYPLECEGERVWVIGGAHGIYLTGHFGENGFVADSAEKHLTYGGITYAGQSFSGLPEGTAVMIFWERPKIPGSPFVNQMSIPVRMHMEKSEDGFCLCALPDESLNKQRREHFEVLPGMTREVTFDAGRNALDLYLKAEYDPEGIAEIVLFGHTVKISMKENLLTVSSQADIKMPVSHDGKTVDLRIVVDRDSAEIFADNGRYFAAARMICDYNLPAVSLRADRGLNIGSFGLYTLGGIHGEKEIKK